MHFTRSENHLAASARWGASAKTFAMTLVLLCAGILRLVAAQNSEQTTGPTIKVTTNVVNVYAVVRSKDGELIPNLTKDDFEIKEDNNPQKISYFSRETDTPLTLAMMIDTSPSQGRVLDVEKEQADAFLRQILRPKDLACVVHFDLQVELLEDFTSDSARLAKAIDETEINGGGGGVMPGPFPRGNFGATHLYDAIYLASNELMSHEVGRKVLILLTDGEDQGSQEKLESALDAAQKSDVIIYSIAIIDRSFYGSGGGFGFNGDSVLQKLSKDTGGRVITVNKIRNTSGAFDEIAQELRTQYLLGYTPSNPRTDSGFRKITVRMKNGNYKVQARRGYYPH